MNEIKEISESIKDVGTEIKSNEKPKDLKAKL